MRIKSYFVRSVDEAIAQARKDLGEDALLLNTRKENSLAVPGLAMRLCLAAWTIRPRRPEWKPQRRRK